jgi:hypothetical protein
MAASNNHRLTVTVKPNSGHTLFRYTAKDIDGKVVRGAMGAVSAECDPPRCGPQAAHAASAGAERPVPSAVHAAGFGRQSGARVDDHLAG